MREVIGRSTRRLAIIGIPLALLLALVVVLGVWADDDAPAVVSGGNLVQYQVMLGDAEGGRFEILLPDGFEYVGLAAGSEVTVVPDVSRGGRLVVWERPFPGAGMLRFWVAPDTPGLAPQSLPVEGAGVEAVRVEPLARLRVDEEAEPMPDAGADATADAEATAEAEPAPDVGADATADAEPTPDVGADATADAEATAEAEPASEVEEETPADAEVTSEADVAAVSVVKSVEPDALEPGDSRWVTYEVIFSNSAGGDVSLDWVTDTLPTGFLFGGMAVGSDPEVGEPDDSVEPDIAWEGVTVPGNGTRTLRYYARAVNRAGDYENSVVGQADSGQIGPDTATLYIEAGTLFLPSIIRYYPERTLPFIEEFSSSALAGWEPFTNWRYWDDDIEDYVELSADRWYWGGEEGVWGIRSYDSAGVLPENKSYDLFMYNAPGAQEWTDYRIEARMKDVKDHAIRKGQVGIWFRGRYENSGAMDGRVVGGYYLYMRPLSDNPSYDDVLLLYKTDPSDPALWNQGAEVWRWEYDPGIGRKNFYDVEITVQGNNINVKFGPEGGPLVQAINWTDPENAWPKGTVGLATFFTAARWDYIRVYPLD